jgi:hypothetical protein
MMSTDYRIVLALLAGVAIGGTAAEGLHAKTKPVAYVVGEVDVTNYDAFVKEYVSLAIKALGKSGTGYKAIAVAARPRPSRASRQSELS